MNCLPPRHSSKGFYTLACLTMLGFASFVHGGQTDLWSLGTQNQNPQEFSWATWETNPTPGSATLLDDDYYFAGTYPAPIGTLAADEPLLNFESTLNSNDPSSRIHFILSPGQATATLQLRFTANFVWGGWWDTVLDVQGKGYGTHTIQVRMNGQLIGSQVFARDGALVVTANAGPGGNFIPVAGANVLEFTRSAGTAAGSINFDNLKFEIDPTALVDTDNDGMKLWWEEDHGFNDQNAADAAQDADHDGLTNLQEFTLKTNPHSADTDADGLNDGTETTTNPLIADIDGDGLLDGFELSQTPPLNPLLADTDNDGVPDSYEIRTGYAATNAASTPPTLAGAIGVNFVYEGAPDSALGPMETTGIVPQFRWNNSTAFPAWNSATGNTSDVASPIPGTLVNGGGATTGATITWSSDHFYFSGNGGGSNQRLLDGYLNVYTNTPATISMAGIPHATYDILVYVGSYREGDHGYVRLNDIGTSDRHFQARSLRPETQFIEPVHIGDGVRGSTSNHPWMGNVVRFRNVTGSSFNVKLYRDGNNEVGIHAIQTVPSTTDANTNDLPDWWEVSHRITSGSAGDPDGDGLSNLNEFTRGTNPQLADTDGDGLSDLVETGTGIYRSATNTGSHPLLPDSDGDGLRDGAEITFVPEPRNPNVATPVGVQLSSLPVLTATTFTWDVSNVQLVWNHATGHAADNEWDEAYILRAAVRSSANPDIEALAVGLRITGGRIFHHFHSNHSSAFSYSSSPYSDIWESDWGTNGPSLAQNLGFSGVGTADISDRLQFLVTGTKNGDETWNLVFQVRNMDTNFTKTVNFTSSTLSNSLNPATTWQSWDGTVNKIDVSLHPGIQLFQQPAPLETTAGFGAYLDTDEDGMIDSWEALHLFNPNSNADGSLDADSDGLSNLVEFLLGTNPRNADSDNDGASDALEKASGSNPMVAASLPPYFVGPPAGITGEDLNGNGLPDAWELRFNTFQLPPSGDADSDGQTNAMEAAAGTNPFDPNSVVSSHAMRTGNDFLLCWKQILHKRQRAWDSDTLGTWTLSPGTPTLVSNEFQQLFPNHFNTNTRRFFKVTFDDLDTDNDGVSDWTEQFVLKSQINNPHSLRGSVTMTGNATLSGDYTALLSRFQGARSEGGFPGSSAPTATSISKAQAARFLMQASFGPTPEDIEQVQTLGYDAWINAQTALPATLHSTYATTIAQDFRGPRALRDYNANLDDNFIYGNNLQTAFARAAIQGEDQLRQRVAFALSQILVASRRDASLENQLQGMADFYDIFTRNAFGNYHEVLRQVALHPCMGRYLSHVGNQKANPAINQYPDENFAREVMQLFSIGLWELNADGTRQLDLGGQPIPTYGNTEITQLARVFTGLWFSGHEWGAGGWYDADYATPMSMHADRHDFGQKTLLNGFIIPQRSATDADAMRDVDDAIRHLFLHHNTGPFICKQLIQFLVTDNPSPAYVGRVAAVFANNGGGVRGDLKAVTKAILLDEEARDPRYFENTPSHGRLKEPVIRTMALGRAFGLQSATGLLWWDWGEFFDSTRQAPSYSPSVFNFFRPDYRAPGILTTNQLSSPVFQITDSYSCISFPNRLWRVVEQGFELYDAYRFPLNLARESALAGSPENLVDHLNTIVCAGNMSVTTRTTILNAITHIPANQPDGRARVAIYLALVCPEGAIMK